MYRHARRRPRGWCLLLPVAVLACGGSGPVATPAADAAVDAAVDVPPDVAGVADAADTGTFDRFVIPPAPDAAPPPDFAPPPAAVPLPAGLTPPQRFLPASDRLTGGGINSCSHQEPASGNGDRWCVFSRAGTSPAATELWVTNISKAARGQLPACTTPGPDCLRLTSTLWTGSPLGGPGHPYSHAFQGDTLIFYADATSGPQDLHRGPVYAWRPGWSQPRQLTSVDGLMCFGHTSQPVAHCMDDVRGDALKPESFELRAGALEPASTGPLPAVARLRPLRSDGTMAWGAAFTRDGKRYVFSSPDPDPAVEAIRIVDTAMIGQAAPAEILRDGTYWALANDDRLYFLRDEAPDEPALFSGELKAGALPVKLGSRVGDYLLLEQGAAAGGIAFLASVTSQSNAFRISRDGRTPEAVQTVFTYRDFLEDVHISPDLRFTAWLNGTFVGRVVRHSDLRSCRLNTHFTISAYEPLFLESAGLVFWSEDAADGLTRNAFHARPDDCGDVRLFAAAIELYQPIADRGLVYTDERDNADHVSLKYAAASNDGGSWRLQPPVRIHDGVDTAAGFTVIGTNPRFVVFRIAGDGTYAFLLPL
jgi:hypothetical protein